MTVFAIVSWAAAIASMVFAAIQSGRRGERPWLTLSYWLIVVMLVSLGIWIASDLLGSSTLDRRFTALVERDYPGWHHAAFWS